MNRQQARESMMLAEPLPKVILTMAYPTIIAFLITSIYSMADIYFVSSLGTNATAAVSVNSSLDSLIMVAGSLFAVGASSRDIRGKVTANISQLTEKTTNALAPQHKLNLLKQ